MANRLNYTSFFSPELLDSYKKINKAVSIRESGAYFAIIALLVISLGILFYSQSNIILIYFSIAAVCLFLISYAGLRHGRLSTMRNNYNFAQHLSNQRGIIKISRILHELPTDFIYFSNLTIPLAGEKITFDFVVVGANGIFLIRCFSAQNRIAIGFDGFKFYSHLFPEIPYRTEKCWSTEQYKNVETDLRQWMTSQGLSDSIPVKITCVIDAPNINLIDHMPYEIVTVDNINLGWFKKQPPLEGVIPEKVACIIYHSLAINSEYKMQVRKDDSTLSDDNKYAPVLLKKDEEKSTKYRQKTEIGVAGTFTDNLLLFISSTIRLLIKVAATVLIFFAIAYGAGMAFYPETTGEVISYVIHQNHKYIPPFIVQLTNLPTIIKYNSEMLYAEIISDNPVFYSDITKLTVDKGIHYPKKTKLAVIAREVSNKRIFYQITRVESSMSKSWVEEKNLFFKSILKGNAKVYKHAALRPVNPEFINTTIQPVILLQKNSYPSGTVWYKIRFLWNLTPYWISKADLTLHKSQR
ncbi:MAG: hypothetical protein ACM3WV_06620 [Bacillota bacterium]